MYKIPLTNAANQTFNITVPVNDENKSFTVKLNYNPEAEYWNFSLFETFTEQPIFVNIPLLASMYRASNILRQQHYLKIGSIYITAIKLTKNSAPNSDDLGTNYIMIWADNEMSEFENG